MQIDNFVHKGLQKLYHEDLSRGVPPDTVDKLRKCSRSWTTWKTRKNCGSCFLEGAFTGRRSKSNLEPGVTRNLRLTFCIDPDGKAIRNVNLEDYH